MYGKISVRQMNMQFLAIFALSNLAAFFQNQLLSCKGAAVA